MSSLIEYLFAIACLLLVVSLPLGRLPFAKTIRKWALACFLLALAPSVLLGLLHGTTADAGPGSASGSLSGVLSGIGFLAIVSTISYLVLVAKGHVGPSKKGGAGGTTRKRSYRFNDQDGTED